MKYLLLLLLSVGSITIISAQNQNAYYPKNGQIIKDYTFSDVINNRQQKISISDYKGKWLILDFWAPGCVGCIESFPKMDKMALDFKDSANILLVGLYGTKKGTAINNTRNLYSVLSKKDNLKLSVAFDSASFDQYGVRGVPFIMVINPKGEVVAKTRKIDSIMFSAFIAGKHPDYMHAYSVNEKEPDSNYNFQLPLLDQVVSDNGNSDTAAYCRSILKKWDFSMPEDYVYGFSQKTQIHGDKRAEMIGFDLISMLRLAYTGYDQWGMNDPKYTTFSQDLILEIKNPEVFGHKDISTGKNMYSYSLIGYGTDPVKKQQRLLADLENSIGFKSSIETRNVMVWKITVSDRSKLEKIKTQGGAIELSENKATGELLARNFPLKDLNTILFKSITTGISFKSMPVIVDGTGLDLNIDLKIPSFFDKDRVNKALENAGLRIVQESLPMKCIVVKDL